MEAVQRKNVGRVEALKTLRQWISDGTLKPGDPLPAERDLAKRLDVGRNSLRWAVRQLDMEGLIRQASPRTRVVEGLGSARSEAGASGSALMSRSVAILAGERFGVGRWSPSLEESAGGWAVHVILGAMDAIRAADRHALKLNAAALEPADIRDLLTIGVGGVVVPHFNSPRDLRQRMLDRLRHAGVRFVVEGDRPEDAGCDRVAPDHEAGAYAIAKFLIDRGRRRVLHMGVHTECWWAEARLRGYRRAMEEAGLEPLQPLVVPPSPYAGAKDGDAATFKAVAHFNAGYLAPKLTATDRPDAIMCLSDESVSFVTAACRLCNLDPASEIDIAGYDNFWAESWGAQHDPTPPVVTADKQNHEIGQRMVELLLAAEEGSPRRILVAPELVEASRR